MLQKMNLTAVTDVNKVMGRHNEDSLAILPPLHDSYISHYNALSNLFMLGPRAGLPGLVLAITCPAGCCLYLVRDGGLFIAAKGNIILEEVRNAERSLLLMGKSELQLRSVVRASLLMTAIDLSIQLFKFFVSSYTQNPHTSTSSKKK